MQSAKKPELPFLGLLRPSPEVHYTTHGSHQPKNATPTRARKATELMDLGVGKVAWPAPRLISYTEVDHEQAKLARKPETVPDKAPVGCHTADAGQQHDTRQITQRFTLLIYRTSASAWSAGQNLRGCDKKDGQNGSVVTHDYSCYDRTSLHNSSPGSGTSRICVTALLHM